HTLSHSSVEAEYRGVANVVAETAWLRNLLLELHSLLLNANLVYYDNISAVYMSANPLQHQQMKHIEIEIHFVRDMVTASQFERTASSCSGCGGVLVNIINVIYYDHNSVEAEYRGVANVVAETAWLRNLLRELHSPLLNANLVYCDNISAVYMSANPVQHQQMKHIKIEIHFVRDMVTASQVRVLHVPSRFQYADIFNKGLPSSLFEEF
nr:ribonuclease H-like domain-containing protein [Tanacetum cinerariifolium]